MFDIKDKELTKDVPEKKDIDHSSPRKDLAKVSIFKHYNDINYVPIIIMYYL